MDETKPTVLLTNPIQPEQQVRLGQHAHVMVAPQPDADVLRSMIADADCLIVRATLPDDIFEYQTRLKGVIRHGVGLDMIPMQQATKRKIPVANMPGSNTASVVEYCLNAMFKSYRDLDALVLEPGGTGWSARRRRADDVAELNGQTLGIVGVGTIGSALARVAKALGMRVLGLVRRPETLPPDVEFADKSTLFSQSDIVVMSCPLNESTKGLVDADALATMKQSALLINVSRGPVIDTPALIDALKSGRPRAAVLDVHDKQPIPDGLYPPMPGKLFLTPHVAGITHSSMARMSCGSVDEALRLFRGERFANLVNPEIYQA